MRPYLLAVLSSAAIHAAVVAWVVRKAPGPTAAPPIRPAEPVEISVEPKPPLPPADPPPMDVVLLPPEAAEPAASEPAAAATIAAVQPPTARQAAIATSPGPAAEPAAGEPTPPAHSSLMTMRHGAQPQLTLPSGRWDDLDHAPAGSAPERSEATGTIKPSGGGSLTSDQGVFVADVRDDGAMHITDSPNLKVHIALPTPGDIGRGIASWYTADKGRFGETDDPGISQSIQVSPGGPAALHDPINSSHDDHTPTVIIPVIGGSFDVNDWLMRRHGADPYASRKLALLDTTRAERAQIGAKHRDDQLHQVNQLMQRNLDTLWAAIADPAARRQALFELWDECAETGDAATIEAAESARRAIIGFIRARLPAGSPGAFSEAELAGLARTKHSHAAFRPYD